MKIRVMSEMLITSEYGIISIIKYARCDGVSAGVTNEILYKVVGIINAKKLNESQFRMINGTTIAGK